MADTDNNKRENIWNILWNSEEQKFVGRSGISWLLVIAFYVCFYSFLAAFFTMCLAVFYETLDSTRPTWEGTNSLTQDNPGLGFRPIPQYDTTLIRFQQGKPSSYKPYTDHLEAFLMQYEDGLQVGRNLKECQFTNTSTKERGQVCRVDLDKALGQCTKEKDFGYEEGEPCVLLKMNRVFGFEPIPYESEKELLEDNKLDVKPRFLAFREGVTVGLSCEGAGGADRENILDGGIEFYPNNDTPILRYAGFPAIYFPFLNQEGYRSPFVMVKFKKFARRVVIQIECKLYAKNIDNSGTGRRHGVFRFELLKD